MTVTHCSVPAAEVRAAVSTTLTQELLDIGYFKNSSEPGILYRVFHLLQAISVCDASGVNLELIRGRSGYLLYFLMKAGSAFVPVMVVLGSEGGQEATKLCAS
ncbi:hypothetical protein TNCV_4658961 [Trichonephila clavipes]|nr:hypothetical protein TNCV_4658961 [Trichonephila clavipes]